MQARAMQVVQHRTKLKPAEAIDYGKVSMYGKTYGEMDTVGFLLLLIVDWNNSFVIDNKLSDNDCADCAHLLYRECSFLSMAEIAILLERSKYSAKIYGSGATQRIGKDTFWGIVESYMEERKKIVLSKKPTVKSKYEFKDGKWIPPTAEEIKGASCPPEVLQAIKSIGAEKERKSEKIEVDERSRDEKNKIILLHDLKKWFPREMNKAYQAAEYRYDRWGKPCTVEFILESRKVRVLTAKMNEARKPRNL